MKTSENWEELRETYLVDVSPTRSSLNNSSGPSHTHDTTMDDDTDSRLIEENLPQATGFRDEAESPSFLERMQKMVQTERDKPLLQTGGEKEAPEMKDQLAAGKVQLVEQAEVDTQKTLSSQYDLWPWKCSIRTSRWIRWKTTPSAFRNR
jgi:uncharacterized Zn finger protein